MLEFFRLETIDWQLEEEEEEDYVNKKIEKKKNFLFAFLTFSYYEEVTLSVQLKNTTWRTRNMSS